MKKWKFTATTTLGLLFFSTVGLAGGMVSSGGQIFRDANNPWWLKNTTEVKYCVQVDAPSISASPDRVALMVEKALQFWRGEFSKPFAMIKNADEINQYFNSIGVGSQTFVKEDCRDTTDLKFLLGAGALSPKQKDAIPEISRFIGITIRESYDEVNLKGRGFIYIASDVGKDHYDGGPTLIETPWKYDALLVAALVHELGHVFGLSHGGERFSLMSEQFLEYILNRDIAKFLIGYDLTHYQPVPSFFSTPDLFAQCSTESRVRKSFRRALAGRNIPKEECLVFRNDLSHKVIELYSYNLTTKFSTLVGQFRDLDLQGEFSPAVTLVLTSRQTTFLPKTLENQPYFYVPGPSLLTMTGSANFVYANAPIAAEPIPVHLRLESDRFEVLVMKEKKIQATLKGRISIALDPAISRAWNSLRSH